MKIDEVSGYALDGWMNKMHRTVNQKQMPSDYYGCGLLSIQDRTRFGLIEVVELYEQIEIFDEK